MGHVFISYSRNDRKQVDRLVAGLEKAGHEVWRDVQDIEGGDQWRRAIVSAIKSGYALIVAISPRSMASDNVRKELDVAEQSSVRIIPVRLAQTTIPDEMQYQLVGVQEIDASSNFKAGLQRLRTVLAEDARIAQPARRRRKRRLLLWMLGGATVVTMAASLLDNAGLLPEVVPSEWYVAPLSGAFVGLFSGLLFRLIGWVSRLVGWVALLLTGGVVGAFVAERYLIKEVPEQLHEWTTMLGVLDSFTWMHAGAVAGVLVAAILAKVFSTWRRSRRRARIAALAR